MNIPSQNFSVGSVRHLSFSSDEWSQAPVHADAPRPQLPIAKSSDLNALHLDSSANEQQKFLDFHSMSSRSAAGLHLSALAPPGPTDHLPIGLGLSPSSTSANSEQNCRSSPIQPTALPTPSLETSVNPFSAVDLAHASAHPPVTPGGHNMPLSMASSTTISKDPQEHVGYVSPKHMQRSKQLLPDIGASIDELASAAADARVHFHGGRFDTCNEKIDSIKQLIKRIAEMGMIGLTLSTETQHMRRHSTSALPYGSLMSPDEEKQIGSAATFSALADDVESRKRRLNGELHQEHPFKSQRGAQSNAPSTRSRSRSDLSDFSKAISSTEPHFNAGAVFSPKLHSNVFDFNVPQPASLSQRQQPVHPQTAFSDHTNAPHDVQGVPSTTSNPSSILHSQLMPSSPQNNVTNASSTSVHGTRPLNFAATASTATSSGNENSMHHVTSTPQAMDMTLKSGSHNAWTPSDSIGELKPSLHLESLPMPNMADSSLEPTTPGLKEAPLQHDDANEALNDRSNLGGPELSAELRSVYEETFHEFLTSLCSNLEAKDERGELIHQTLMPKKMARLDESPDFRPFKFRIQAFTNAFQSELQRRGLSEDDLSMRKIKLFLWTHPFISRFNEDGKKAKSKGNHIWIIEARRLPAGRWEFFTFSPKIAAAPSNVAYVNEPWTWNLRIWDPQMSSGSVNVAFSANAMPSWLHWEDEDKVMTGVPHHSSQGGYVNVSAVCMHLGELHHLEHSFYLHVADRSDPSRLEPLTSQTGGVPDEQTAPASLTDLFSPPVSTTPQGAAVQPPKNDALLPQGVSVPMSIPMPSAAQGHGQGQAQQGAGPTPGQGSTTAPGSASMPPGLGSGLGHIQMPAPTHDQANTHVSTPVHTHPPPLTTEGTRETTVPMTGHVQALSQPQAHAQLQMQSPTQAVTQPAAQSPSQLPSSMSSRHGASVQDSQKYDMFDPSRPSHELLPSMPFPFTPPIFMDKHVGPTGASGMDPNALQSSHPPDSSHNETLFTASSNPTSAVFMDKTPVANAPVHTPVLHSTSPVSTLSSTVHTPALGGSFSPQGPEHDTRPMMQMWNHIDQRQREQASSFMLLMPQRPQSFTLNEHPGQGTPISNMPNDMNATLPSVNQHHLAS